MAFSINIKSILPNSLFVLLAVSLILSCTKENSENFTVETLTIDAELAPYFERFVTEGQQRGTEIDLTEKRIEGFLIDIEEKDVAGQCSYDANSTRKVNIDLSYWNKATDLEKEFVVFHELGHCYLDRSHLDTQTGRSCTSIMHSGTSPCRFRYTSSTRGDYLDELYQ